MQHLKQIYRLPEVMASTGLSRSSIYAYIGNGAFPAPIKLGSRSSGWLKSEIDSWVAVRIAARNQSQAWGGCHA